MQERRMQAGQEFSGVILKSTSIIYFIYTVSYIFLPQRFTGAAKDDGSDCKHHPGVPIFHEGLKFWSCCQRRTTDFQSFLNQEGCEIGKHKWIKEEAS